MICAPRYTCGGTANRRGLYPTDLTVARLPRVTDASTFFLLPRSWWRFKGFLGPVGKVQSPPYQNGFPESFSSTFTGLPSNIQGGSCHDCTCRTARFAGANSEKMSEDVLGPRMDQCPATKRVGMPSSVVKPYYVLLYGASQATGLTAGLLHRHQTNGTATR